MFKLFQTSTPKELTSHIGRLVQLAKADGDFDKKERDFIRKVGISKGLQEEELDDLMFHPHAYDDMIPESKEGCFTQLVEYVEIMTADGHVCSTEKKLFFGLAKQLGFKPLVIDLIFAKIERGIEREYTMAQHIKSCKMLLNY